MYLRIKDVSMKYDKKEVLKNIDFRTFRLWENNAIKHNRRVYTGL